MEKRTGALVCSMLMGTEVNYTLPQSKGSRVAYLGGHEAAGGRWPKLLVMMGFAAP